MVEASKYTDDDVKAIIERALEGQAGGKSAVTHADLIAIGEQVGISRSEIDNAARAVLESRRDDDARKRVGSARKRWLLAHAAVFALMNGLFFAINALTTPGEWWALFPIVWWGLALAVHAGLALGKSVSRRRLQREIARMEGEPHAKSGARLRVAETPLPVEQNSEGEDVVSADEQPSKPQGGNRSDG